MSGDDPHLVLCQKTPSPEVELVLFLHLEVEVNMESSVSSENLGHEVFPLGRLVQGDYLHVER